MVSSVLNLVVVSLPSIFARATGEHHFNIITSGLERIAPINQLYEFSGIILPTKIALQNIIASGKICSTAFVFLEARDIASQIVNI